MPDSLDRLVASPCCLPGMSLDALLPAYAAIGFTKLEAFTTWAKSAFDVDTDPEGYRARLLRHGMAVTSFHLPPVDGTDGDSFDRAVGATRFARDVGARIVLFKATDRAAYIRSGRPFLDAIDGLGLVAVLQNHYGSPIATIADFAEVLDGIDDARMRAVLEVGHFHAAGVSWREGCDLLGDKIALVHVKDQTGAISVPYGSGEIDLPALLQHLGDAGYDGDFVVEMEVPGASDEETLSYLTQAIDYLRRRCFP